jgi:hypothetical protein
MRVILAIWEAESWWIMVQGQTRQIVYETLISKITRAKLAGGMAQVVGHLLCNHEALSSNPIPTTKKEVIELSDSNWMGLWQDSMQFGGDCSTPYAIWEVETGGRESEIAREFNMNGEEYGALQVLVCGTR